MHGPDLVLSSTGSCNPPITKKKKKREGRETLSGQGRQEGGGIIASPIGGQGSREGREEGRTARRELQAGAAAVVVAAGLGSDTMDPLQPRNGQGGEQGGGQGPGGVSGVWQRLHRSGVSQQAISTGWRILHAALPVRSKVAQCLGRPLEEGLCDASGCGCQESLSHALMDCDKVRGAIDWLLDLFEAISGRRPPRDPRVILADDHRIWEAGGTADERLLWQRLRLTVLSHIWRVRSLRQRNQRRGDGDLSVAAINGAAMEIQRAVRRDWARTRLVETQEEAGGNFERFSGRDPSLSKVAFLSLWAGNNVLCHLSPAAPGGVSVRDPAGWLPPRTGGLGGG